MNKIFKILVALAAAAATFFTLVVAGLAYIGYKYMEPFREESRSSTNQTVTNDDLESLTVMPRVKNRSYERELFGESWTDATSAPMGRNGCDTRNDVLGEQLTDVRYKKGSNCVVIAGTLDDPYTGKEINFSKPNAKAVQIDHIVPLSYAYDMGAAEWLPAQREKFANDTELNLLAVDGPTNQEKSDKGPGEWMPSTATGQCEYATKFVATAKEYDIAITQQDKAALAKGLGNCN